MTIHEHAPNLPANEQRRLTATLVDDINGFIRRREAEGVQEIWIWTTPRGDNAAAYFYDKEL